MENKAFQQYFKQVKQLLVCDKPDRERLLTECKGLMSTFQQENPDAEYDEFVAAFGAPSACAADLLSTLEGSEVEAARKRRLWVRRSVYATALAVFALLSAFLYYKYDQSMEFNKDTVVVIEPVTVVPDNVVEESIERTPKSAHSYGGEEE